MINSKILDECYIAHVRESDGEIQSLEDHLLEVSDIASAQFDQARLSNPYEVKVLFMGEVAKSIREYHCM